VILTGRAELRRLRGTTLADEIQGQVIIYDNLSDQFTVDGAPRSTSGRTDASSRVRAVLTPKPKEPPAR
jgi:lipopolysaccharide export system protein LptA